MTGRKPQYWVEALDPEGAPDGPWVVLTGLSNVIEAVYAERRQAVLHAQHLNRAYTKKHGFANRP